MLMAKKPVITLKERLERLEIAVGINTERHHLILGGLAELLMKSRLWDAVEAGEIGVALVNGKLVPCEEDVRRVFSPPEKPRVIVPGG